MSQTDYNKFGLFQAALYGTPPQFAMKRIKKDIEKGAEVDMILYKNYDHLTNDPYMNMGNVLQYYDCTLLMVAIIGGNYHIVKMLIELGANCHYKNNENKTPFTIALSAWYEEYVYKKYYYKN